MLFPKFSMKNPTSQPAESTLAVDTTPCTPLVDVGDERFQVYRTMRVHHPLRQHGVNAFDETEWLADIQAHCTTQADQTSQ